MGGLSAASNEGNDFNREDLKAFQAQLASLAQQNTAYPIEYSLGACDFLFESRQDIEVIVDNLSEEILVRSAAA